MEEAKLDTMLQQTNVEDAVEKLYEYRDCYISTFGLDKASEKNLDVAKELQKTLELLSAQQEVLEKTNKAKFYMLKGRALNIKSEFDAEAFEYLTKSIKLNPNLVEAWNELGACYWKKGDVAAAKNCFQSAMEKVKNKVSIRNLSMVLRQLGETTEERKENVKESVVKAKEAVEMDFSDGMSWTILGNAYLTYFFSVAQNPDVLKKCFTAYQQAEKDQKAVNNSDLHFNRSVALQFEEEYESSLKGYASASILDPSWELPCQKEVELINYMKKVQEFINKRGCLKPKRVRSFINAISQSQLGPYSGGKYSSPSGKEVVNLESVNLKDLASGANIEKVVLGKVVATVYSENSVPLTFCIVDKTDFCCAVTVYNLASGKGVCIGDSVAIPEPYVTDFDFEYKQEKFNFRSIRVDIPVVIVLNGRKLGRDCLASIEVSVTNMSS